MYKMCVYKYIYTHMYNIYNVCIYVIHQYQYF